MGDTDKEKAFNQTGSPEQKKEMDNYKPYQLPENYDPADYPPVKMRNGNADRSETQRKRRSKNRLSNRRSTGYVPKDIVEDAIALGTNRNECVQTNNH